MLAKTQKAQVKTMKRRRKQALIGAAYIAPSFILMLTFNIFTLFLCIYFSFTKYNMVSSPEWIAWRNYEKLLKNPDLMGALQNTLWYVLMTVPLHTILALIIAAFIADNMQTRYGSFLRSVIFIPVIVSLMASATIWNILYEPDSGVLNQLLTTVGLPKVKFLADKNTALASVAAVSVWKSTGYYMVIYYAGIMNISSEIKEAAIVDGARPVQRFWHITLPILKPITYMIITLSIIGSFQVFDLVYKMTGGGPGGATDTVAYMIYRYAFKDRNIGRACALAVLLMIAILIIHGIETAFFKEKE